MDDELKERTKEDTISSCFDYMLEKFGYDNGILIFGLKDSVYHVHISNINAQDASSILSSIAEKVAKTEDIDE